MDIFPHMPIRCYKMHSNSSEICNVNAVRCCSMQSNILKMFINAKKYGKIKLIILYYLI